jgi:hypothetical protein
MPAASKRKPVQLSFDASLYPLAAVRAAAVAFGELAASTVKKQGARIVVKLCPHAAAPTDEILCGELGNYALGLACESRRQARPAPRGR